MSLLVPDYSSSSDEDEETKAPVAAPTAPPSTSLPKPATLAAAPSLASLLPPPSAPSTTTTKRTAKKQKQKKPKTALFLHPDIQRLLESGASRAFSDDSDDSDDDSLLAKQKRALAAKRPRVVANHSSSSSNDASSRSSTLAFLPPPKHTVADDAADESAAASSNVHEPGAHSAAVSETAAYAHPQQLQQATESAPAYDVAMPTQYEQQQYSAHGYYDAYAYDQQQTQQTYPVVYDGEDQTFGSSKRARTRDRELERALQQGHFHSVATKIVEVHGPAPSAWAPPSDSRRSDGNAAADSNDLKVKASFWDAQKGARVATVKPNRMQRQKHQLNQLAFDAKLREHELLDKKGVSLKTKAETHAKYGW